MKKEWIKKAYENAKAHGFHDGEDNNAELLMLVISEIAEAVEADRKGTEPMVDIFKTKLMNYGNTGKAYNMAYRLYIKGSVGEELADVCIRLFDFMGANGMSMDDDIKMQSKEFEKMISDKSFAHVAYLLNCYVSRMQYDMPSAQIAKQAIEFVYGWSHHLGIDLDWNIEAKMRYNSNRSYKHGKKY